MTMDEAPPAPPDPSRGHDPPAEGSPQPPFVPEGSSETALLRRIRERYLVSRPFQFGIRSLLLITAIVSALFSMARMSKVGFGVFFFELFLLLFGLVYLFGPAVILLVAGSFRRVGRATRVWIALGVAMLLLAPIMMLAGGKGGIVAAGGVLLVTSCIWMPQSLVLWWMWRLYFRRVAPQKETTCPTRQTPARADQHRRRNAGSG